MCLATSLASGFGNGVETQRGFNPKTGLISTIHSTSASATVQNHQYQFDSEGNLKSRTDHLHSVSEQFCYDDLNRLTSSGFGSSCSGGKSITYDYHGNIKTRSDVQNGQVYQYGQSGAGPHAVTAIGNNTYRYNSRGEMLSGGGRSGLKYTTYGKPTHMQKGSYSTDIIYSSDKNRIQRIDNGPNGKETTTYIGKLFERVESEGNNVTLRHYIGENVIHLEKTINSNFSAKTVYLHKDHIGSIIAKTDESGAIVESLANEAWGRQVETTWNGTVKQQSYNPEETDRGFTDHEHMTGVGLIHMNGRVYDSEIGRFVSPDLLIQDPENSQAFNRYTYVWNNPLRYTDPTGLAASRMCRMSPDCVTSSYVVSGPDGNYGLYSSPEEGVRSLSISTQLADNVQESIGGYFDLKNEGDNNGQSIQGIQGALTPDGDKPISLKHGDSDVTSLSDVASQNVNGGNVVAQEERTLGSYLPGTEAGDNAAQYWADIAVNSGHPLAPLAHVPGVFAALWTDETATNTAFTLGTAGVGTVWRLGLSGGSQSVFWSGNNMVRAQGLGTTLETTFIGGLANGRIGTGSFLGRKFWEYASRTFAGNARGAATKVGTREGYFWRTFERPILERNNIPINVVP